MSIRMAASTLAALAFVAGCGGDDDAAVPNPVSLSVSKNGSDYELTAPATMEAGLAEVSLQVDTPATEEHEAQLVRVEGDQTLTEALQVLISDHEGAATPPWLFAAGGIGSTAGGKTATVTQILQPGTYYVFDLGEGEGDNVPSFAEQGATATIEVTGEAGDAELPDADATVTAEDYGFATEGLVAGVNRIRFDNSGKERHHIIAIPYEAGATLEEIKAFATSDAPPEGPPPVDFSRASVTAVLEGGDSQITELNLTSGKHAFICFISKRAGGPPHASLGMINEVVVGGGESSAPAPAPSSATSTVSTRPTLATDDNGYRAIRFRAGDGAPLVGRLWGSGEVEVILAHGFSQSTGQDDWLPFATMLAERGYMVMTFNFRGFCDAEGCSGGGIELGENWRDARAAVALAEKREAKKIFLVGASMGGLAVLCVSRRCGAWSWPEWSRSRRRSTPPSTTRENPARTT